MRLLTYLQQTHGVSRRKLVQLIDQGKIFVNEQKVESYTLEIQEGDKIRVLGKNDEAKPSEIKSSASLLLFNKPKGYVVAKSDPHEQTIYKILPYEYQKWYYIGRLDKESHGLLLMTDDPKLVHEYEHPSHGIQKEYVVELDKQLGPKAKNECLIGVKEEGEILKAIKVLMNRNRRGK
jgi:23S rRNA pseudouridine2605 synthase